MVKYRGDIDLRRNYMAGTYTKYQRRYYFKHKRKIHERTKDWKKEYNRQYYQKKKLERLRYENYVTNVIEKVNSIEAIKE